MSLHQLAPWPGTSTRAARMLRPALTIGGLAAATLALHVRDPHASGSWGACPSAILGFSCPGCGGLRGVHDLTDLRLVDAASSNLLLVLALPVAVVLLGRWALDSWTGRVRPPLAHRTQLVLTTLALVTLAAFTLARNLPFGAWLAP
jgi:hypothetical protein